MEFIKKNLLAIIVAGAAVLALILGAVMAGATAEFMGVTVSVDLFKVVFGPGEGLSGGLSIFGLISFLALIAGIVLTVISMFKGEKLGFIGAILVAVAGVLMFFLLTAGTAVSYEGVEVSSFAEYYAGCKLGFGAIIYAILAILGGGFGILNKYKKIV